MVCRYFGCQESDENNETENEEEESEEAEEDGEEEELQEEDPEEPEEEEPVEGEPEGDEDEDKVELEGASQDEEETIELKPKKRQTISAGKIVHMFCAICGVSSEKVLSLKCIVCSSYCSARVCVCVCVCVFVCACFRALNISIEAKWAQYTKTHVGIQVVETAIEVLCWVCSIALEAWPKEIKEDLIRKYNDKSQAMKKHEIDIARAASQVAENVRLREQ